MMRKLLILLAALATTLGLAVPGAGSASALGGESFGCRIAPGTEFNFYQGCHNTKPANQYSVGFAVQNWTTSSTFSWSIPADYQSTISQGCTSTSPTCTLSVGRWDQEIDVAVTLTDGGASKTLTSVAMIFSYCGLDYC
jgi:hypothetical protein